MLEFTLQVNLVNKFHTRQMAPLTQNSFGVHFFKKINQPYNQKTTARFNHRLNEIQRQSFYFTDAIPNYNLNLPRLSSDFSTTESQVDLDDVSDMDQKFQCGSSPDSYAIKRHPCAES